ncbi:Centromere/kinetochore Zw10-domain-containing protein [Piptocephalis cylindrospora]|uniref:Centromere/kinetochore Zw10-domain-containing protein n=1 Tax=Piptocephalis cylindrospora TaxID=1907219 RepID=A0A4P9Y1U8_9FUNG|nr:Centromere/kinetochore Zw10-domain-containing protein [Piptocephalis cylindrospora]|eukprot:RKP12846.1 Centromere/kinetochore Zw10-domain-containing protein [Piptocephalis cylindrospora]
MPPAQLPPEGTATLVMTALQAGQACPEPTSGPDTSGLGVLWKTPANYTTLSALLSELDGEMETTENELIGLVKQNRSELTHLDDQVKEVTLAVQDMTRNLIQARQVMNEPMNGTKAHITQILQVKYAKEREMYEAKSLLQVLEPLATMYRGSQRVPELLEEHKWEEADETICEMGLLAHTQYSMGDALTERLETLLYLTGSAEEEQGKGILGSLDVMEGSQEILGLVKTHGGLQENIRFTSSSPGTSEMAWSSTLFYPIFETLQDLLIHHVLRPLAPASPNQFDAYEKLVAVIKVWVDTVHAQDWAGSEGEGALFNLMSYLNSVEDRYVEERKIYFFQKVKHLVKEGKDWDGSIPISPIVLSHEIEGNEVDELGLASLLHFPECLVSQQAQDLLKLIHSGMEEAVSLQTTRTGSRGMSRACQEALVLYRVLSLSKHQKHISSVPSIAALFHNDWQYLAHHALILQSYYRPHLPKEAFLEEDNGVTGWMGLVESLRLKAESFLHHLLQAQIASFTEDLREMDGFYEVLNPDRLSSVEKSLLQVMTSTRQLAKQLKPPMLPRPIYARVMGQVMDALLNAIIQEMLQPIDISVDESVKIHSLTHPILSELTSILEGEDPKVCVPSWSTFEQVVEMMNLGLRDIMSRVRQGLLTRLTRSQVSRLVRALFSDTELRTLSLQELSSSEHLKP